MNQQAQARPDLGDAAVLSSTEASAHSAVAVIRNHITSPLPTSFVMNRISLWSAKNVGLRLPRNPESLIVTLSSRTRLLFYNVESKNRHSFFQDAGVDPHTEAIDFFFF